MTDAEHAAVLRLVSLWEHLEPDELAAIERAIEKLDPPVSPDFDYSEQHVHRDFCELWTMLAEFDEHLYCSFAYDADRRLIIQHFHGRKVADKAD